MSEKKFEGKVILITGASSGIGEATAKQFAAHGASLAITGRNKENLEKVAKDCKKLGAAEVLSIIAEFSKMDDVKKTLDVTIEKFSRLDVLVNNAGAAKGGNLSGVKMEDFDFMFNVNVKSMVYLTQLAIPHLVEAKGNIVNVSSFLSVHQSSSALVYCMTKSTVDQFTKTVALEYAPKGVRVNAVNPANVQTSIGRAWGRSKEESDEYYRSLSKKYPMGITGTTDQVANAIIFLASDDSAWTTGQCFKMDGGLGLTVQS